jgi:hypothetical protein
VLHGESQAHGAPYPRYRPPAITTLDASRRARGSALSLGHRSDSHGRRDAMLRYSASEGAQFSGLRGGR